MDPQTVSELIKNLGIPTAVLAYFLVKDWRFSSKLNEALAVIQEYIETEKEEA